MSICLLSIDPQVDFMPGGALGVPGADEDMKRLAAMVNKHGGEIDDIQITMDSHFHIHIAHSCFWQDEKGKRPDPFTSISVEDVEKGKWRPKSPEWNDWALNYVKTLEQNQRYQLTIWPDHCIIGSPGQCIQPDFLKAVSDWEETFYAIAPRTTKGSNPFTEHYSAVKADVSHPQDPNTRLNGRFVDTLKEYDTILIAGEALSHCVNFTITDVAAEFSEDQVKKFVLLEDASSSVPGFERLGDEFVARMQSKGMQLSKTDKFF
jgi:nicotinamidase-related amidase